MSAEETERDLIHAIKDHPAIVKAAITGSHARDAADRFSDLDVLLVASNFEAVRDVRGWLPASMPALICAFHLSHYCTVLLDDFQKIDLAIFPVEDPSYRWVVHDYEMIKGGADFEPALAAAAESTRTKRAAHLNPDISVDNILLLLITARFRVERGELLSAHSFLAMACDMLIALETQRNGVSAEADLLDSRRRLERLQPTLATAIHRCLFVLPVDGIPCLARFILTSQRTELDENQSKVLGHLLKTGDRGV